MKKIKLTHKVFLAMMVVFLIPTISITYQFLHYSQEAVLDLQRDAMYSQAVRINQELDFWFLERVNDLRLWQEHLNLLKSEKPNHNMHSHWKQDSSYESLFLFDSAGNLGKSFGIHHEEFTRLSKTQQAQLRGKKYVVLGSTHNHFDNHLSIHLGVSVVDPQNIISYNIVVLNITDALNTIFATGQNNYPYKISILIESGQDILTQKKLLNSNSFDWFSKNHDMVSEYLGPDKTIQIALSHPTAIKSWYILISSDKEKTFNWIQILKQRIGLTVIISVLVVLILGGLLSWGISRPINRIIQYARDISTGIATNPNLKKDEGEAQIVIVAINEMIEMIRKKNIELQNKTTLAAVGELTSSVVHEFRNPLSSVKMNLQAIKHYLKEESTYSELTQIALDQTLKLESMLSELLTFGKPVDVEIIKINPIQFVEKVNNQIHSLAKNKNLQISIQNLSKRNYWLFDENKMLSILINLIENAAIALNYKGNITIKFSDYKEGISIMVTDDGPGIPANLLGELFYPFVTSRDTGTGLGLSIVMKFIKLHGGSITVQNLDSKGAQFKIYLPQDFDGISL